MPLSFRSGGESTKPIDTSPSPNQQTYASQNCQQTKVTYEFFNELIDIFTNAQIAYGITNLANDPDVLLKLLNKLRTGGYDFIVNDHTIAGLLTLSHAADLQMMVGFNTGASRNSYLALYDGLATRRGYVQGLSTGIRIRSDQGGQLDILTSGLAQINGNQVWTQGNHGPGSGLNADFLDGLHGSNFLRSDENDSITGLLNFSRAADEQFTVGYNTGASRNPYFGIYDGLNTRRGYIQGRSGELRVGSDAGAILNLYGSGDARVNGNKVMHAGNGGAASGFDADLLDGQHGSFYRDASNLDDGTLSIDRLPDDIPLEEDGIWSVVLTNISGSTIPIISVGRREYYKNGDICFVNCLLKVNITPLDDECRMSLPFNAHNLQLLGECWMLGDANTFPNVSDIDDYMTTDGIAHGNLNHGSGLVRDGFFYFKTGVYGSIGSAGIDNGWLYVTFRYRMT